MNESLFLFLNNFAGQSNLVDAFLIFSAQYLIFFLIAGVLVFLFLKRENFLEKLLIIFGSAIIAWIFSQIINWIYPVARPFLAHPDINLLFEHGGHDSFPSGHATFAFALATVLFYYHKPLAWLYILGALLIGLSRIVAGVHWPIDILGGFILGGAVSVIIYFLYQKFKTDGKV